MKFEMITGRTIRQGEFVGNKLSDEYSKETTSCHMNPIDMMYLGVTEGKNISLESLCGAVVMTVKEDDTLMRKTVFIPYGPYCNMIIPENTHGTGMPDYKSSVVTIIPTEKKVISISELFKEIGGKEV